MTALAKTRDARRAPRSPAECRATARVAVSVEVIDASANGIRARISIALPVGTTLKIGLPGAVQRHARIIWSNDGEIGCEFLAPLSEEELGSVLAATPDARPR
ncbi:PilZ domain-containing protein [uncultured Sphingomonas sp.]|uniref:PilZ domain-containing protein n=1 Tax=uncultured Sphingomonas sp. TaxID=158754 RepID=UPI00262E45AB|nr:PilZ domain-containing protein [uncultured Sphingomonas sp.]